MKALKEKHTLLENTKRMDQLHLLSKKINSEILIDIGANIGFYSILFSDRFAQIYSFEPNERNLKVLKEY